MSIRKHLPPRPKDGYTSLQVKMETSVVDEVKSFMKIDGISWNDLLTACFTKYLEESRVVHGDKKKEKEEAARNKINATLLGIMTIISLIESPILQVVSDFSDYLV